ncbi:hypothetical protein Hmuk_1802 [Halomicrobium mukohataei DSM 12286]|uniref:Uncharacterized protein n=1 Tax=Halomicrobium mukohataei (strain ATCC 700874 / DSM 12286 / JCM 9738 / NCIMB 13541) TaxID=485914 RepID=C7P494_HALMD|nr:hypothetical protein Hmuk_1802 [Halomicrobium mukohataei DSM 12286]
MEQDYNEKFGSKTSLTLQPTESENQTLVSYAITVDQSGVAKRYRGTVSSTRSRSRSSTTTTTIESQSKTVDSESAQRHSSAQNFVQNGGHIQSPSRITTGSSNGGISAEDVTDQGDFSEWGSSTTEFGDCEGGKVVMTSSVYTHSTNDTLWGLGTTTQVIPGRNTTCDSAGTTDYSMASHQWGKSHASDPTIVNRAPTGTEDGTWSVSGGISVSVGTDTSGSGSLSASYSQPDLYFSSSGSTEATELNWSYNSSSHDITWQKDYLSLCDLGDDTDYRQRITADHYEAGFNFGPDASNTQYWYAVPNGEL